ncbi:hypothetical protein [Lignipirellula cremea]|nr:hypothetical protein [Lignipirellula cremea]
MLRSFAVYCLLLLPGLCFSVAATTRAADPLLPGTQPLEWEGDIAAKMVDGIDRFLLRETAAAIALRERHWRRDLSSPLAYAESLEPNRKRLAHILGLRDARPAFAGIEIVATTTRSARVGRGDGFEVIAVRWRALDGVDAEGLLLTPTGRPPRADVIALPDADQTPEMIAGLAPGVPPASQYARRLAESGCRVLVPLLINRDLQTRGGKSVLTNREWLYRPSFVLGRHLIGYELQKTLAAVDAYAAERDERKDERPIAIVGYGEGGMLSLYAAALDPRLESAAVCGFFGSCDSLWQQGVDRNVFGLLEQFGDAELAAMVAPRRLVIEASPTPQAVFNSKGGAPGRLETPSLEHIRSEAARANKLTAGLTEQPWLILLGDNQPPFAQTETLQALLPGVPAVKEALAHDEPGMAPQPLGPPRDLAARHQRQMLQIERHTQAVLEESAYVRKAYMSKIDASSLEKYADTIEPYREHFRREVIGNFDRPLLPPQVRSRLRYDQPKWLGYDVVLDVFPDVFAYGVLLLPKDLKPGDKRPVVVCQHGLEGRPKDTIEGDHRAYHDYAARLCEQGFIVFAPQNPYIGGDRFRTLQRKANPLQKSLFSIMVPQHQQIVDWLGTLPHVDAERIGFYGLSYGGKSAMRIPALVDGYCLSICSADFNEWVRKNASTRARYSYVWTGEYEIFEFDLGSTFNYAEMAALIAPRPFMVERGHFDGVAEDEEVAFEFAKVRRRYAVDLGLPERCEIEWFVGPHMIHGKGTFAFLKKHLRWPETEVPE